jgi:hypothetical protein
VRLALDEHYAPAIAEALRDRGHDVVAVAERADLAGLDDRGLFRLLATERRALLTENWADFQRELQQADADGVDHYGVVFSSRRSLPRSAKTIGLFVRALDVFLRTRPAEDALLNSVHWLQAVEP